MKCYSMTDNKIINQWKHERELAESVCSYFVDQVELSLVNETIDLINRQKAEIERLKGSVIVNNIMESQKIKREAIHCQSVSNDMQSVVRCKDCKYLMFSDLYGECSRAHLGIVRPDDFCSYGERKDKE